MKSVYSPGLHFGFALAWCLALEGSLESTLESTFRVRRPNGALSSWSPDRLSGLEVLSLFLVLFFLRAVDEWKDFEYDKKQNPHRPLVTGKSTFTDLYLYLFGAGSLVLMLNLPWLTGRSWIPFLILAADLLYGLFLIIVEKKSGLLRENILLNLLITYPVNVGLSIYVYWMVHEKIGPASSWSGLPILGAFTFAFLNYEFARKTCWPEHAPAGTRLYSSALGPWGAAAASLTFAFGAVGIMTYEFRVMRFLPWISLIPPVLGSWHFSQDRCSQARTSAALADNLLASCSRLFLILFYTTLILCSLLPLSSYADETIMTLNSIKGPPIKPQKYESDFPIHEYFAFQSL